MEMGLFFLDKSALKGLKFFLSKDWVIFERLWMQRFMKDANII